jgi:hypothetical protein
MWGTISSVFPSRTRLAGRIPVQRPISSLDRHIHLRKLSPIPIPTPTDAASRSIDGYGVYRRTYTCTYRYCLSQPIVVADVQCLSRTWMVVFSQSSLSSRGPLRIHKLLLRYGVSQEDEKTVCPLGRNTREGGDFRSQIGTGRRSNQRRW